MNKDNNKKSILTIMSILAVILIIAELVVNYQKTGEIDENKVEQALSIVTDTITTISDNVVISEETQSIVNETIEATENNEDLSTTEVIESSEDEEQNITDEGALEVDAVVEQENISYDGDSTGNGLSLLGSYQGLTYYSQADSRWGNIMYSSTGNTSQTMKSSACRTNFGSYGCI